MKAFDRCLLNESKMPYERVEEMLWYDPISGSIFWRVSRGNVKAGGLAGWASHMNYREIRIGGKKYKAHRIAWLLVFGHWPSCEIDHIDGRRDNNSLKNLREVTRQENCQNICLSKANKSGVIGVEYVATIKKWHARIGVNRRKIHLGDFRYFWAAVAARKRAERKYKFHSNHGRL